MSTPVDGGVGQVECFPIRAVAAMTGVSAVTLRAWERRYALVVPARTESGHRLYSSADVAQIRRIVQLLERGVAVGRVASLLSQGLPTDEVGSLPEDVIHHTRPPQAQDPDEPPGWHQYRERLMKAISGFDEPQLNAVYNEALSLYPLDVVNERLVIPTLRALGERWSERPAGIAEEHFFSSFLRNKLGARFHHLSMNSAGPKLVAACMPGERHELGLLMFCLAATQHGYRAVMLGPSVPTPAMPPAIQAVDGQALVLSTSVAPNAQTLRDLTKLVLDVQVPVFVGGISAGAGVRALHATGVNCVGKLFVPALRSIDEVLAGVR